VSTTADAGSAGRAGLARSNVAVAAGTLTSRVTGLVRVAALALALGGGTLADVYNLANNTPNIVYELLVGGVLSATIVPIFVRQIRDHNDRSISAIFTVTLTVLALFTVIAMAAAPLFARLFSISASGNEHAAQLHVVTVFTLCFMPQIVFYGFTALATALLNAHRRFVAAAFAPALNNVVVIAMLLVFAARTTHNRASWTDAARVRNDAGLLLLLGIGTTVGIVAMALVLVPALKRARAHLRPVFAWRDAGVRTLVRLSGWTLGYVITNQIAQLLVLIIAKTGASGDVAAYVYAFTFYVLPYGLLAVTIMTTMTPEMSARAAAGDVPGFRREYGLGLRYLIVLVVPASVLFAVLAHSIVGVLHIGKFDAHAVAVTGDTLQLFAISLVPFSVYLYTLRGFYAYQDTRTPFFINAVENAINIGLALALFPSLGVQGLALAWSIAYAIAAVIALVALRRRVGGVPDAGAASATARSCLGAAALAAVAAPLAGAIGGSSASDSVVAALVAGTAGGLAYLGVLVLLRSDELRAIVTLVRGRGRAADVSP
jgi:putative peptidoglycan lipid II flippase